MFASELPGLFTADGEQTHEVFGHHKRDANPRSGTAKRRAIPPFRFVPSVLNEDSVARKQNLLQEVIVAHLQCDDILSTGLWRHLSSDEK